MPSSQAVGARFGEVAVRLGLLAPRQVEEGLEVQAKQRRVLNAAGTAAQAVKVDPVGEILQRLGYLDEENIERVLKAQEAQRNFAKETTAEMPGNRRIGDFTLVRKLGAGAMGAVYLARQNSLDRFVALKILPPDLAHDQEFLERFRREARAAARLSHPNVVVAYDVGVAGGYHYIAMEFVEGEDLERALKARPEGHYPASEVIRIAKDMARALICANGAGIVHRDVKPANILRHSDGVYKLTDLGLAAPAGQDKRLTSTGIAVGTPYYISPEQARGELKVDVRSDIYSLGATLFHLATGRLPFPGENAVEVMTRHLTEQLQDPMEVEPGVPKPLSRLIQKMMAKRPEDRQQTPGELLEDIEMVERGEVPLLKRARSKARPNLLTNPLRSPWQADAGKAQAALPRPSVSKPPRLSNHPRVSRPPGAGARAAAGPLGAIPMHPILRNILLLVGFVLTAIIVGILIHMLTS